MKYSEAKQGRIFIMRLEDGDIVHEEIERFAVEQSVTAAVLIAVGGADEGSKLVVGPAQGRTSPILPLERILAGVHEVAGTGTIFPDAKGNPMLHMHMACGRNASTITGCVRSGVKAWHVIEIILIELLDTAAARVLEPKTGFELLKP